MTAGPTPLPPAVSQVMAEPITYHRAPAFIEVYARALERLREVLQTGNPIRREIVGRLALAQAAPVGEGRTGARLLVFGGSQGARALNHAMMGAACALRASASRPRRASSSASSFVRSCSSAWIVARCCATRS